VSINREQRLILRSEEDRTRSACAKERMFSLLMARERTCTPVGKSK